MIKSAPSRKTVLKALSIGAFFFLFSLSASAQTLPFITEGKGVHFEVGDGSAPPITLDSTEIIDVRLVSALETTTLRIESSSASSTILTIGGLSPERLYFIYTGDYHHKTIFTTGPEGRFSFVQNLTNPQFLIIQPRESTYFIRGDTTGGDCVSIGIWNSATKTCVLTGNLTQTIQIDSNDVTLDGGGYMLSGPGSGMGVFLTGRKGVTIKNLTVRNFRDNIALVSSEGITIEGNTFIEGAFGVSTDTASSTNITRNTFTNPSFGIFLLYSNANILSQNIITNFYSDGGISLSRSNKNTITRNHIENGPVGITLQLSLNNIIQNNTIRNGGYYAMNLQYSQNNEIFQNNFLASAIRHINSFNSVSLFNRALPDGGNYWDTYDKPAEGCTDTNTDDFCDTPLVLDRFNTDFFPRTTENVWKSTPGPLLTLSYADEEGFRADAISPGIHPNKGTASSTSTVFKAVYMGATAPSGMNVLVGDGTATTSFSMTPDATSASTTLRDGIFGNGEQYITTSTFPKGKYQYSFEAQSASTTVYLPADGTLSFQTGYSNVAFLPGLEASRLYRPDYNGGTDQLWEPNTNSDAEELFLTEEGKSVRSDVYTKDVIDEKNVLPVGQGNIYKSFLNDLEHWKNTDHLITDYTVLPYDWRLSLDDILNYGNEFPDGRIYYSGSLAATTTPYIIQELHRLAATSETGKVTIVAHSNGGLVTKALMQKLGDTEVTKLIDKVIFIAVPQTGTPQALGALLHGFDQGLPFDSLPLILTPETARMFAENMPSAYNLLPAEKYFSDTQTPVATFDNSPVLADAFARYGTFLNTPAELYDFLLGEEGRTKPAQDDLDIPNVLNKTLLDSAETVKQSLDNWVPPVGVEMVQIAGWGEDTLATIEYYEGKKTFCSGNIYTCTDVPTIMYNPKEVVDGDGTVVVPSALWTTASSTTAKYWVNLRDYGASGFLNSTINRKHADILEVPSLRTLIQNILTNMTSTLPQFISTTQPTALADDERLRFLLHSPLNLSAIDNLGNTTNSATSTIPGGSFKRYGEVQVLKVPKGIPITLNLEGYATGSFTLDLEEINGNNTILASSTLSAIPSATSTTATMAFTDGTLQNASSLLLDYDGNGTTDFTLKSKIGETIVFDITPPEALISFSPNTQKLTILGIDETSSTTVSTTATRSLITDEAGNTLEIMFKKLKQEKHEIKLEIQGISYNGVPVEISKTALQYEWSVDKQGNLKEFEQKMTIGDSKIEAHYDAKKNVTKIKKKLEEREDDNSDDDDKEETKESLPGLVIINLTTDKGRVEVSY
ncbi:MAG: right-handed parallel beta-helix repeat-containing protein [Candidatus Yonathbacteria bacterium]|nr:right-handed parallel beta-helix repeat-containing protein [Candidatus Yonathbacteria bacterium]